jgi:hypothetical protein
MIDIKAFIAYAAQPALIGQTIESAVAALPEQVGIRGIRTWKETDVVGQFVGHRVLEQIEQHDCLVADISELNFNVTYEIGFAIGKAKPLLLVRYSPLEASPPSLAEVGIFDTMGYKEYENSPGLVEVLREIPVLEPVRVPVIPLNTSAPVYLIDALFKTDPVTRMIARVKKARLSFRSFDPNEQPRLSAFDAIQNVTQSYGVLLHLLPSRIKDAGIHNLRVAFLAGLATGMGKALLILQDGDEPVPLDYRDLVVPFYHPSQIDDTIADFATRVTEAWQARTERTVSIPKTFLETMTLGSSSAENELRDLGQYYLETDAFRRALRSEARLVVGRKGSGKTALFLQLRDNVRRTPSNVVLDLRPEGYKLVKFKEVVLDLLEEGTLDHTLTAFWEYLLLLEICRKLLENDRERHMRDGRLFEPYKQLAAAYQGDEYVAEGDFSERMSTLLQRIRDDFDVRYPKGVVKRLSQAQVTELLYRHDVAMLRGEVIGYLKFKESVWLLFDNLDKGWPTHGIRREDLVILRTLLEATRKLEREFSNQKLEAHTLVFLRNDVFELLVEETPDRGKEAKVGVDWTDPDLLRELVRRRIVFNDIPAERSFAEVWPMVCTSLVYGEESSQFLIERSLMRPRALLDLIGHCRSCAVNLGHAKIDGEDIRKGLSGYSTDLVREIGLEIRDVLPEGEDALYAFIDVPSRLDEGQLRSLLEPLNLAREQVTRLMEILLWYGVLGLVREDGEVEYIYSLNYDMRLLMGRIRKAAERAAERAVFAINPAFWPGLGIRQAGR